MANTLISYPSTVDASWGEALSEEFQSSYMSELVQFLKLERSQKTPIYPPEHLVFSAFNHTPMDQVKVLVIGQDPYHGPGQAHGLSFSVLEGVKTPPSLRNIYLEMEKDVGIPPASHGNLTKWAKQGVMLLNATLTVRQSQPKSHYGHGWERFTNAVVAKLLEREDPCIFVLWGRSAKEKLELVLQGENRERHLFLTAAHPSPFSAYKGFFGCRHFSKINTFLEGQGKSPIDWAL